jgi:uncharacterized protein (DUF58 family)
MKAVALARLRPLSRLKVFSGLTLRGRCLVAAGLAAAVCAVALSERDLLRVAAFVTALPLLSLVVSNMGNRRLTANRQVVPDRVTVGSPSTVVLRVGSQGRLGVATFVVEDDVPSGLGARPRFLLGSFGRKAGASVEYPVRPHLRGIHLIGPVLVRVSDPFGLTEFRQNLAGRGRLVALPEVAPLTGLPAGAGQGTGEDGSTRLRAGRGEDGVGVRQYRYGDDMRRVHWKSTARRDELMVRVEERPWQGGVTLLLDRRAAAHRGSGAASSLEWSVSAVASIGTHLHRHGQPVRLVTEDAQVLSDTNGLRVDDYDNEMLLDALAMVSPSAGRELNWDADPAGGRELIAVLGAITPSGVAELTRLRPQGTLNLAVLVDVRVWGGDVSDSGPVLDETAQRLRASGWTVVIAEDPQASVAAVWHRLCHAPGVAS